MSAWPDGVMVLIPAYKAAASLRAFLPALVSTVPAANVLVVDDGSADDTSEACRESSVRCCPHSTNRGKGAALRTGFDLILRECHAVRWIVTMDADGQHAVADLPAFLETISAHPETGLCIGWRERRPGTMPLARICSNALTSAFLSLLTGQRIRDSQCGYRVYAVEMLRRMSIEYDRFEMESEVILKASRLRFPIRFVRVQTVYSRDIGSHISHVRDTLRWVKAVLGVWLRME